MGDVLFRGDALFWGYELIYSENSTIGGAGRDFFGMGIGGYYSAM